MYYPDLNIMDKLTNKASDRFFEIRQLLGFSQVDFARKLSTTQGNVSNIEKGRRDISIEIAMALNEQFSISTSWILMGRGEMIDPLSSKSLIEIKSNKSDLSSTKITRKTCSFCTEKDALMESFRETIEALKGNLTSKDAIIDVLKEALSQAKLRLEEHGLGSNKKPNIDIS